MFTWICPKCGREVLPAYSECPHCKEWTAGSETVPPESPPAQPGPPAAAQAAPGAGGRAGLPSWLLSVLFALSFVVVLGVGFYVYQALQTRKQPPPAAPAFEPPTLPTTAAVKAHPIAAQIEVTGLRLTEDSKQRAFVQFVVVNHSAAEIGDLAANVNLKGVTARGEQQPVGTFSFKIPLLGPYESKDLKASVDTKLRVYELPDWQFLRADFQITSP